MGSSSFFILDMYNCVRPVGFEVSVSIPQSGLQNSLSQRYKIILIVISEMIIIKNSHYYVCNLNACISNIKKVTQIIAFPKVILHNNI
jgi:hypothetical protein